MNNIKELLNNRSKRFTEFHGSGPPRASSQCIDFYNEECASLFEERELLHIAKKFLNLGTLKVLIPAYEEHEFGSIYKVLAYFDEVMDRKNILVIDADSKDKTAQRVKQLGYDVIIQSDIEKFIDLKRISHDFSIELPLRAGKGKTLFLAAIYQKVLNLTRQFPIEFNLFSDADITNPKKFNFAAYLAWVASQYPKGRLLEIKSAQHNRNNQSVMNAIAMLQTTNPTMYRYYKVIREMIWPLTGEILRATSFVNAAPCSLGYGNEMLINMASVDFIEIWRSKIAQIEIPVRCIDAENTEVKEAAMTVGISTLVYALNEILFKKSIRLIDMQPKHYKKVNEYLCTLEHLKEGLYVSTISHSIKPNKLVRIRLDRILPSIDFLLHNGYVDVENLANSLSSTLP